MPSPVRGARGAREFLIRASRDAGDAEDAGAGGGRGRAERAGARGRVGLGVDALGHQAGAGVEGDGAVHLAHHVADADQLGPRALVGGVGGERLAELGAVAHQALQAGEDDAVGALVRGRGGAAGAPRGRRGRQDSLTRSSVVILG